MTDHQRDSLGGLARPVGCLVLAGGAGAVLCVTALLVPMSFRFVTSMGSGPQPGADLSLPRCTKSVEVVAAGKLPSDWTSWPVKSTGRLIADCSEGEACAQACGPWETWELDVVQLEVPVTRYHGATTGHGPVRVRMPNCCGRATTIYKERSGGPQTYVLRESSDGAWVLAVEGRDGAVVEGPWGLRL